jgi:hypothetical protein
MSARAILIKCLQPGTFLGRRGLGNVGIELSGDESSMLSRLLVLLSEGGNVMKWAILNSGSEEKR